MYYHNPFISLEFIPNKGTIASDGFWLDLGIWMNARIRWEFDCVGYFWIFFNDFWKYASIYVDWFGKIHEFEETYWKL